MRTRKRCLLNIKWATNCSALFNIRSEQYNNKKQPKNIFNCNCQLIWFWNIFFSSSTLNTRNLIKWTNSVGMKIGVYLWVCGALFIEFIYLSSKRVKAFDILFVFAYRLWFWFSPCQCISRSMRERVLHVTWHSLPRTSHSYWDYEIRGEPLRLLPCY